MTATTQIISSNRKTTTTQKRNRPMTWLERSVDGASEITPYESSLFKDGKVDFKNYVGVNELFTKLSDEAKLGVDVAYADYQTSLIHLLKHCYGYFYALKNDTERYHSDIKQIDQAIRSSNLNSNSNNPLEMKIIKLAWGHNKNVDRRRLSTYAKTLTHAWCKGEVDAHTDEYGSVKPEHFFEEVMSYGGVQAFSRQSKTSLHKKAQLTKEGYDNIEQKKRAHLREALTTGTLKWGEQKRKLPTANMVLKKESTKVGQHPPKTRDGTRVIFFCEWEEATEQYKIYNLWDASAKKSAVVKAAELSTFKYFLTGKD